MVFATIKDWIAKEEALGSPNSQRMILATSGKENVPHSRIVAIKEISEQAILFFTQKGTRKDREINQNPIASATIWLPLQQRQIILDGKLEALSTSENEHHWQALPRQNQLKFLTYAPISTFAIDSVEKLQNKYQDLEQQFANREIPITEYYIGYQLFPNSVLFYTLKQDTFSDVIRYDLINKEWQQRILAP